MPGPPEGLGWPSASKAPDDVAVNRIVALLVEKMSLPLNSPDGQIMSYKLHHRRRFITFEELYDVMISLGYHR